VIILSILIGRRASDIQIAPSQNWESTMPPQCMDLWVWQSYKDLVTVIYNQSIGSVYRQKYKPQHRYYLLKMKVKGTWTIIGLVSWMFKVLCNGIDQSSILQPALWARMLVTILRLTHTTECQHSVIDFWHSILDDNWAIQQHYCTITLSATLMGKCDTDNIATTF